MAINPACYDAVFKETGRELTDQEIKELGAELDRRRKLLQAEDEALSMRDAALKAADNYARDVKLGAIIEKRNAVLNLRKKLELQTYLDNVWADRPADGFQAILTGVQRAREGARRSVALEQQALHGKYLGGITADIEAAGHTRLFASGAIDQDVARALWQIDKDSPDFKDLLPEAVEVSKIIRKWQEVTRLDANAEGAWIGKLDNYVVRQGHDVYKIRKAGYQAWRDGILPRLDLPKTLANAADTEAFLKATYEGLASGIHLKAETRPKMTGFKGPSNIAKRASQERVLHFKSADDWMAYNQEFGAGSIREALFQGLRRSAQSTGIMRILGSNPENMLDAIGRDVLERTSDPAKKAKLAEDLKGFIRNRLMQVDGTVNMPGNAMGARVSANARALQSMAKLGGAVISSITDIPVYASEVRFQGRGMLDGMAEALGGVATGRPKGERAQVLSSLGVFFDSMAGEITRRGSLDDNFSAGVSRTMNSYFKFNLLNWWTESLRGSAAMGLSHFMAAEARKGWAELGPEMTRMLGLYGIDEKSWPAIQRAKSTLADGREYLTPEGMDDVQFPGLSKEKAAAKREKLKDALRALYVDRAHIAVIEPDAETMAMMRRGTRPGTAAGEFLRFVTQFKSFGIAVTQKVLGREVYGYGSDSLGQALKSGQTLRGLANVILMTTLFGYAAQSAKEMVKGRSPRDPKNAGTWLSAMIQGGGFGIYGDFLLGQKDRFGGDLLSKVAGPVIGTITDIDDLRARAMSGDDVAASALKVAINNTPFVNLFYTRMALDHAILFEVQEAMNPGYLRRMERLVEKENNQSFWLSPSEAVN